MVGMRKVFAVTVNWKRCEDTLECVNSLLKGGISDLHVIVVDNGSDDGSVERLRREVPSVEVIPNADNLGYAAGANQGISTALDQGATHVLVINNDAIGTCHFLERMLKVFDEHPSAGVVGCRIDYYGKERIWYGGGYYNSWLGYSRHLRMDEVEHGPELECEIDFVTGCVMLISADVLKKVGSFDERFEIYAEDLDLCLRAKREGYEVWYVSSALCYHKVSSSTGVEGSNIMTPFRSYFYARNMLLVVVKDAPGIKLVTGYYGQLFILIPYYFLTIGMQRSQGAFRKYISGFLKGTKMIVEDRWR